MRRIFQLFAVAAIIGLACNDRASAEFIVNGGFETGDFAGWTLSGNTSDPTTFGVDSSTPHSGNFAAYFGPQGSPILLTQAVKTSPGVSYLLRFFLNNEDGGSNEFSVVFGSTTLQDSVNLPVFSYQLISYTVTATAATTNLTFGFRNEFAFFNLDDVSLVSPVPEPASLAGLAVGLVLAGGYGLRKRWSRKAARVPAATTRLGLRRSTSVLTLATLFLTALSSGEASAQIWAGYGSDPQHTCQAKVASQLPQKVLWSTPVDLNPPFQGGELFIHYAGPVITRKNTVIVTVRNASGGFQFSALRGQDGSAVWPQPLISDYVLPPHNWIPVCGPTLVSGGLVLAMPGAGGTVYLRTNPDRGIGTLSQVAFYGMATYNANKAAFNSGVFICTPITADGQGNLYFGFAVISAVTGGPAKGGLARISSTGQGSFVTAADATGDATMQKVVYNCAPALSNDGNTVYVAVNQPVNGAGNSGIGYLVALDSHTLNPATAKKVRLKDVRSGADSLLPDDGSGTPTVGPDGDVYFGVLENPFPNNNARGWLLHFSGDLATTKTPGSFGWDDTASIVPASAVPSYTGKSTYLVLTKYNDYADPGLSGQGLNKLAILDPNDTQTDTDYGQSAVQVMKEVITVLGPTPNLVLNKGVREWCINSAAIDPINKCAVVNSEDGSLYRWDFITNTLVTQVALAQATGEAYTPTVIGPDGAVYAINRAVLNCCVKKP